MPDAKRQPSAADSPPKGEACDAGRALLIGYGNPGRLDDGLGPALAAEIEKLAISGVTVESNYQLTVEDAAAVAECDVVIFADASVDGAEPFFIAPVEPRTEVSFSSHSVAPAAVLGLARDLFGRRPAAYAVGVRGYEFDEFGERLSPKARQNLRAAVEGVATLLSGERFRRGLVDPTAGTCAKEDVTCKTANI